jgi:pyridinium-3,5-bisthiocarboxylic acid mononucleotide nickel chelatase
MTTIAYLDCVGGLAGDMLLGALLDAGAPASALEELVAEFGLDGHVAIEVERVQRGAVGATQVHVTENDPVAGRSASELLATVGAADLPSVVRTRSIDALSRIADIEGSIHGADPAEVHLHELGGLDTLIDVVGAFVLLDALGVERLVCSPLPFARGLTGTSHGPIPIPGPATLALLRGAPLVGTDAGDELVTPTGAAIVAVAADGWGELPAVTLAAVGYGAGARELPDRPNVLRVVIGHVAEEPAATSSVVLLEANLDDLLPELVPDAVERCSEAGALDVWTVPVQMKKGRPGIVVSALARPGDERAVAAALLEHTSTLGVRVTPMHRYELHRRTEEVEVDGRPIRIKVGVLDGRVVNIAPEHDDCAAAAAATGRPVKQIWAEALAAATREARHVAR